MNHIAFTQEIIEYITVFEQQFFWTTLYQHRKQ